MEEQQKIAHKLTPVGVIQSCFSEKFGIPRQAGLVTEAVARIVLQPPFDRVEMVKGLEQFSHIWVHFIFHQTVAAGYRPTIRPPGLGGHARVGVFASRSPHRPNHLGFSVVRLMKIVVDKGVVLEVKGGDFLDGTPVVDIKPYTPYSDSVEDATSGYSGRMKAQLQIAFSHEAEKFCEEYESTTGRHLRALISQVIYHDPRPACQHGKKEEYGMLLWNVNIRFKVVGDKATVVALERVVEDFSEPY